MTDWNRPSTIEFKLLHSAIYSAYPKPSVFESFLFLNLGKNLAAVAPAVGLYKDQIVSVLQIASSEGWLNKLVDELKDERPNNYEVKDLFVAESLVIKESQKVTRNSFEKILRKETNGIIKINEWIRKFEKLSHQICRIEHPVGNAIGTGFLVDKNTVMTNWHVVKEVILENENPQNGPSDPIICRFDYQIIDGKTQQGVCYQTAESWCVDYSPASEFELKQSQEKPTEKTLDYAIIRLEKNVEGVVSDLRLDEPQSEVSEGEIALILQHPQGQSLGLAIGAVNLLDKSPYRFFHDINTLPGSSGSPILNTSLELIGLHQASDILYSKDETNLKLELPEKNQGIPITKICRVLKQKNVLPNDNN